MKHDLVVYILLYIYLVICMSGGVHDIRKRQREI